MELKPNMYVRTPKGIAKVTAMLDETHQYIVYTDNENIVFEYYLTKDYLNNKSEWVSDYASKWSFDVIDLVELGDYVNGYPIYEILEYENNTRAIVIGDDNKSIIWEESSQYIKSIVTKEQFEAIQYKVV